MRNIRGIYCYIFIFLLAYRHRREYVFHITLSVGTIYVKLHNFIKIAIFIAGLTFLTGCMSSHTLISCEDVVTLPNKVVVLRAKLEEQDYHLDDIKNQPVKFQSISSPECKRAIDKSVHKVNTNDDGWAQIRAKIFCEGLYRFRVSYDGNKRFRPSEDELIVLAVNKDKPVIAVDIDGTLTKKGWRPWRREPMPYDGYVSNVLRRLSEKYAIVYLSGRLLPMHGFTRRWLSKNGFPQGPILMWWISSPRWLTVRRYKTDILVSLKRAGVRLVWGIGNTEDDMKSYRRAGLKAIILGKDVSGARRADSWSDVGKILLK